MTDDTASNLIRRLTDELETWVAFGELEDIERAHGLIDEARAYLKAQEGQIPKNCWLDDEPGIKPTPCVFDDPNEIRENCCYAMQCNTKWDCAYYGIQDKAAQTL
jgi:hypothetical protein